MGYKIDSMGHDHQFFEKGNVIGIESNRKYQRASYITQSLTVS